MDRANVVRWIDSYERAWRTEGTWRLREVFAPDATYRPGPFDEPLHGLDAIAAFWESEREGPDEVFILTAEVVAVEGRVGVARIQVDYGSPVTITYRDLWIITLRPDGRCATFEEWPFFPDQPLFPPRSG